MQSAIERGLFFKFPVIFPVSREVTAFAFNNLRRHRRRCLTLAKLVAREGSLIVSGYANASYGRSKFGCPTIAGGGAKSVCATRAGLYRCSLAAAGPPGNRRAVIE